MKNDIYWIWLQKSLDLSGSGVKYIIENYNSVKDFYNAGEKEWNLLGIFTQNRINKLKQTSLSDCEQIVKKCEKLDQKIITIEDENYPQRLKNIYNPPCVIYAYGDLPKVDDKISIAIVGTRKATRYGIDMAFDFAFKLAKSDAIIISGGAFGIDTSAHKGALMASGTTVCVLGCALEFNYLNENKSMRDLISKNGAVISEYPPGTRPTKWSFPFRNRIISGLSLGVFVVEAGEKSGSLITASLAAEQGRDVFAMPGNIMSQYSRGTNSLIKDGAKPITEPEDILEEYLSKTRIENISSDSWNNPNNENTDENENDTYKSGNPDKLLEKIINLSTYAKKVYDVLTEEPQHIDTISSNANLSIKETLVAITELEILSLIKSYSGKRYGLI